MGEERYKYIDKIIPVIIIIGRSKLLRQIVLSEFGINTAKKEKYLK